MPNDDTHLSLADLYEAGVRLRPVEAVTIVQEIVAQVTRGDLPGVPSAHVIRFSRSGRILVEGPVAAGGAGVPRAAQLLNALLAPFDAPPDLRAPGALRLVVARGLGTLDLPPYRTLEEFGDALTRFAAPDAPTLLQQLVKTWAVSPGTPGQPEAAGGPIEPPRPEPVHDATVPESLTISDIRRARRATGLPLADVAEKSRIPAWLLRELEWGYLRNWPAGHYGRTQLVRYARASGLDDHLVVRTVGPLLDEASQLRGGTIVPAVQEPAEGAIVYAEVDEIDTGDLPLLPAVTPPAVTPTAAEAPRRSRSRLLAALAIPALIAIGFLPAVMDRASDTEQPAPAVEARREADPAPLAPVDPPAASAAAPAGAVGAPAASEPPTADAPKIAAASTPSGPERAVSQPEPAAGIPAADAYSPSFASAGTAMFYHQQGDGQAALMRADTDSGGAILRVTSVVDDRAQNFHARPSPDGSLIAFDSDRDGVRAVYIANADGSNVRRVSGEGFAAIPSWSPDGGTLAFVRAEPDRPQVWNLWATTLESGETRRLTSYRVGQPWGASWFPDGRRIAYSHETRLVVRDLETGRERIYPSPVKGRLVRTPAVAPDGRRIMFQVHRDGAWLLEVADGTMRKVLSDPTAEEYTWAPDGRRVAYHSRRSGTWGVWVMAAR